MMGNKKGTSVGALRLKRKCYRSRLIIEGIPLNVILKFAGRVSKIRHLGKAF